MPTVRYSTPAERDLVEIWNAIFRSNGELVAERNVAQLLLACRRLEAFPLLGSPRPGIRDPDVLVLPHSRWLVLYRVLADEAVIIRVVDGARNLGTIDFASP